MSRLEELAGRIRAVQEHANRLRTEALGTAEQAADVGRRLAGIGAENSARLLASADTALSNGRTALDSAVSSLERAGSSVGDALARSRGGGLTAPGSESIRVEAPRMPDAGSAEHWIGRRMDGSPPGAIPFRELDAFMGIRTEEASGGNGSRAAGVPSPRAPDDPPDPDRGLRRSQAFGRNLVRGAGDLKDYSEKVEKSAKDFIDSFDPPGDPAEYRTTTRVPEPQPVLRNADKDIESGDSPEVSGTLIIVSAIIAERVGRLLSRMKGGGRDG
ncbi:hypothetical protein [Salininema proteolyticum]|uniref:Uncharacterized protein n=1 Tax=Salininema proteolyticum TaxID=1607685 RepID=A0ABV8U1R8_9ACTN